MSKFFQALERAAQEQALRHPTAPSEPTSVPVPAIPAPASYRAPQPFVEPPDGVSNGLEEHLVSLLAPTSFSAEQYRTLRHLIEQLHKSAELSAMAAGRVPSAPYEVLKSPRLGELLTEARRRYDYIVLDTPPLVSFPDCRVIEKWIDGLLIVVAAHRTARKLFEEAMNVTELAKIVGLVFNGDDRHLSRGSYASTRYAKRNGDGWRRRAGRRQTASDD